MPGTADALIAWAHTQIGTVEKGGPHGNDGNVVDYWKLVGAPGFQGQPWCAAFYLAGLLAVGVAPVTRSFFVPRIEVDYKAAGRFYPVAQGLPGDQLIYAIGKGHTGVLVSLDARAKTVTAIEGNTSAGPGGSQDNGGGVYLRVRPWSLVLGVGRPPFQGSGPSSAPADSTVRISTGPTTEDHVTPHSIRVPLLDASGNGYVDLPGIPAMAIVSCIGNGQNPQATGYGAAATFDREDIDGHARVNIHGGVPKGGIDFVVWTTP